MNAKQHTEMTSWQKQEEAHAQRLPHEQDPHGKAPHEPGAKLDAGKQQPWLMISGFANALSTVADVTTLGAQKYSPYGWKDVPGGVDRYMEAFARHQFALARGEHVDLDTGCLHKAQMVWNLLASLQLELQASGGATKTHFTL